MVNDINIGQIAEQLNNKADIDLTNATQRASTPAKETIVGWGMPDYTAAITGISFPYTAPSNGFVMITVTGGTIGYVTTLTVNGVTIPYSDKTNSGEYKDTFIVLLKSGDVLAGTSNLDETFYKTMFVPCSGG